MVNIDENQPMLLDERPLALDGPGWIYELTDAGGVRWRSATANPQRHRGYEMVPEIVQSLGTLKAGECVLDGEVCMLDELVRSDFNQLQDRARRRGRYPGTPTILSRLRSAGAPRCRHHAAAAAQAQEPRSRRS